MAIIKNALTYGYGFNITAAAPVDSRMRVPKKSDLTTVWDDTTAPVYAGLNVLVCEENVIYVLKTASISENGTPVAADPTLESSWVKIGDNTEILTELSKKSDTGHTHNASAITEGTINIARIPTGSTTAYGLTTLSTATDSSSTTVAATSSAVKAAYDKAADAETAANNAQTTANNAASAASNAQSTADNAASAASNAQSTADNAASAASNAQSIADNAASAASNAQSTANNKWTAVTGTTSAYGISKLVSGNVSGKTYTAGEAAAAAHNHDNVYLKTHQTIYNLTAEAGTFTAVTYDPNSGAQTIKVPTKTSHLTNDSNFITSAATVATANNAITAGKLGNTIAIGSTTQPVYFTSAGTPTAISYTIAKSVPSDAVFTDTATTQTGHYAPTAPQISVTGGSGTLSWSGSIIIPSINFDNKGHYVSSGITTYKLPSNPNTDYRVQTTYDSGTTLYLTGAVSSATTTTDLFNSSIYMSGNTIHGCSGYYQDSDERLKTFHNEVEVDMEKLMKLPKAYFTWNDDESGKMQIGTSAQKVRELYPELVSEDDNGKLSVDYSKLSVIALKGIEKLYSDIEMIKKHLNL